MDTTAIIQFVGIVLFSAAVKNDPGVHAILPRIGQPDHVVAAGSGPKATAEQEIYVKDVEDHMAVILYRKSDRLAKTATWKPTLLQSGWEYILLDGERVQFISDGENAAPRIPASLPHAGASSEYCPHTATPVGLRPMFQKPYRGAAAVVDIPAGALDACESIGSERVDTRLLVQTGAVLVIVARKPGAAPKSVTLANDALVYVANVPPKFLGEKEPVTQAQHMLTGSEPHWTAYNEMLDNDCRVHPQPERPEGLDACELLAFTESQKLARKNPPTRSLPKMIDSECSNTQFP